MMILQGLPAGATSSFGDVNGAGGAAGKKRKRRAGGSDGKGAQRPGGKPDSSRVVKPRAKRSSFGSVRCGKLFFLCIV